jgi:hypothetical protein
MQKTLSFFEIASKMSKKTLMSICMTKYSRMLNERANTTGAPARASPTLRLALLHVPELRESLMTSSFEFDPFADEG